MLQTHGMTKAQVLQALYNKARVQGLGFLQAVPGDMDPAEAVVLAESQDYFDYLKGRVMKISLSKLNPWGYDRDNGDGAAQKAIDDFHTGL